MEILIAIGGLILGAFGSWIAYKEVLSPQRQILYSKQNELYAEVAKSGNRIFKLAIQFINAPAEIKDKVQEQVLEEALQFGDNTSGVSVFAPTGVYLAHTDFSTALMELSNPNSPNYGKISQEELVKKYYQLMNSIRRTIGADTLTDETRKHFKKPKDSIDYLDLEVLNKKLFNHQ
ncbi:MAG: hypothetical protein WD607_06480 [Candidatus Paceibacterota bacterium]